MNQETAGRSDNKIKGDNWNFVIMELKQTSDEEVDRGKAAEEAIEQIIRKMYADAYISRTDTNAVLVY